MNAATDRFLPAAMALFIAGPAAATTLYDPGLGTLPSAQGWLTEGTPGYTQAVVGGVDEFSTTAADAVMAGSALVGLPTLNTTTGFELDFSLAVSFEAHDEANRGGFSVIFTGLDPRAGLELSFRDDSVFAYTSSFALGAQALLDTANAVNYTLTVANGRYGLSGNGAALLSGSLVDYTGFGTPYTTPGLLFFGDDTSGARASVGLGAISISAVPEPSNAALVAAGLLGGALWRRRTTRNP